MELETKRKIAWGVAALLAFGALGLLLIEGPWWFDEDRLNKDLPTAAGVIITGFRSMIIALIAGAFAGIGLRYTHKKHEFDREQLKQAQNQFDLAQRQFEHAQEQFTATQEKDRDQAAIARDGQVTGRYVEASKLLASENLTERLCGIYSFERIMDDSPKDHDTVIDVLAAFVRTKSSALKRAREAPKRDQYTMDSAGKVTSTKPKRERTPAILELPEDIQAALRVLGTHRYAQPGRRLNLRGAYIPRANLEGLDLRLTDFARGDLRHVVFRRAILEDTSFFKCDLEFAAFDESDLRIAGFVEAKLHRASFRSASMEGSVLWKAQLGSADLEFARIGGAHLDEANMSKVRGLTHTQLASALTTYKTILPPQFNGSQIPPPGSSEGARNEP